MYCNKLVRELNKNVIKFENMRPETVEKWDFKYDEKKSTLTYGNILY
jgi:hypothetical protein